MPQNIGSLLLHLSGLREITIKNVSNDEITHLLPLEVKANLTRFKVTAFFRAPSERNHRTANVPNANYVVNSLRLLSNLTHVRFPGNADDGKIKDLTTFQALNHLDISKNYIRGDHLTVLHNLPIQSLNIKVEKLAGEHFAELFHLTQLSSLKLDHRSEPWEAQTTYEHFAYDFDKLIKLQKLHLTKMGEFSSERHGQISTLTKLTNLEFTDCDFSSTESLDFICQLTALKNLKIETKNPLELTLFHNITNLHQLESLTLIGPSTTSTMLTNCAQLTKLTYLKIADGARVSNDAISSLRSLGNLYKLKKLRLASVYKNMPQTRPNYSSLFGPYSPFTKLCFSFQSPLFKALHIVNFDNTAVMSHQVSSLAIRNEIPVRPWNSDLHQQSLLKSEYKLL